MLMSEPDRGAHDAHLSRYLQTGEARVIGRGRELQARRRDGSDFPIHLSVGRVDGPEPPQFIGFIRDITLERQALEESRRASHRLMQVARMATMGEMAAGIAHELNQPLAAIANYAHAGQRFLALPEPELEETKEALREIAAESLRAGGIIRRLRDLVRGGDDKRETLSAEDVFEELRALALADARAHDTRMRFQLEGNPPVVLVHRVQITQLLLNLIRNALESLELDPAAGREVLVRARRSVAGDCEIAVCDNGPGVAPEILDWMFVPFRTTRPSGMGLGLPMSQTIAQAHGGSVRYEPATPRGACFMLTLPASEVPA